ncbi:MAG: BACON domain-containing protein [Prevotella sp.]|nr:BACON domain-containing protein [Prevotella sp.]
MKTKNIIAILAALPVMGVTLTACSSDDITDAKPAKEILRVEGGGIELPASQSGDVNSSVTASVSVTADCGWRVLSDRDHQGAFGDELAVQPRQGYGNGTLVITVPRNMTVVSKTDTITLQSDGGLVQRIPIRQASASGNMSIDKGEFSFAADDTTPSPLNITSNVNWTLEMPPGVDWLEVKDINGTDVRSGGNGTTTLYVSVKQALTDADRSTSFTIKYNNESARVNVEQTGMTNIYLNVLGTLNTFPYEGQITQEIQVDCNAEWNAYLPSSVQWLRMESNGEDKELGVNHVRGIGPGTIRLMCEPNTSDNARLTAVVIISGSKDPKQEVVMVEQAGNGEVVENTITMSDLSSLYVSNTSAQVQFSYVANDAKEPQEYGIVYSATNPMPAVGGTDEMIAIGNGGKSRSVLATVEKLSANTLYYVRGYVRGATSGVWYTTNVLTVTTSGSANEPGDSDNPSPQLARQQ